MILYPLQDPPGCELSRLAYRDFLNGLEQVGQIEELDCGKTGKEMRNAEWERTISQRKNALKGTFHPPSPPPT